MTMTMTITIATMIAAMLLIDCYIVTNLVSKPHCQATTWIRLRLACHAEILCKAAAGTQATFSKALCDVHLHECWGVEYKSRLL
jgi:hypothetical protein